MLTRLTIGFVAAATLAGCLPPATAPAPRPLKPEDGPRGSVHVDLSGGAFSRQIQTRFRVDKGAYVLVGHLGGDGQVRVLYPETPRASGWVSGGKTVSLKPYSALYDMSPHMYSFASVPYRSLGAQLDSYDGLGHGYVFMIASRYPIDYYALVEAKAFEQLEIEDYERTSDPRYAIRAFADDIATGAYTLKFASSQRTNLYAQLTGCPSAWGLTSYRTYGSWMDFGYSYFPFPGSSLFNGFALANFYGYHSYGSGYGYRSCRGSNYYADVPVYRTLVTGTVPTGAPPGPVTPRLQRPDRRSLTNPERTAIIGGRSSIDRGTVTSTRRTFDGSGSNFGSGGWRSGSRPMDATRGRNDFVDRPGHGSTSSSGSSGSSSGSQPFERASRPMDTPRLTTPSAPPTPPTTTSTSSSGGETRAERPRPQP